MTDELQALLPERDVTVKGETITVSPLFFGQLPKAVKLMQPLADALRGANILWIEGESVKLRTDWPLKLPQVVAEGGEALIDLLAFIINRPREWFDTLDMDDGVTLTRKVFEVNIDFFAKRIAPMLPEAVTQAPTEQDGAPSSPA